MKILLFDWTEGGHHTTYIQRFAAALSKHAAVIAAVPDATARLISGLPIQILPLGSPRPLPDYKKPLPPQNKEHALQELDIFDRAISLAKPDHAVHLYSDPIIRRIVHRPRYPVPVTLFLFWPRAHYPKVFKTHLSLYEKLRAWFLEYLALRWRQRPDAYSVFVLDEIVPPRWNRLRGAGVFWIPEPPVISSFINETKRSGCILYGALAPRKGIDLLARAIARDPVSIRVVLAGSVEEGFEKELNTYCEQMRDAGADLELRACTHGEHEGIKALSEAKCAVLPYPRHYGMSRILLETATAGTPVVTTGHGYLGYLVRHYNLGAAVDCNDSRALREAILDMCSSSGEKSYVPYLKNFSERYSTQCFENAVTAPFFSAVGENL